MLASSPASILNQMSSRAGIPPRESTSTNHALAPAHPRHLFAATFLGSAKTPFLRPGLRHSRAPRSVRLGRLGWFLLSLGCR